MMSEDLSQKVYLEERPLPLFLRRLAIGQVRVATPVLSPGTDRGTIADGVRLHSGIRHAVEQAQVRVATLLPHRRD